MKGRMNVANDRILIQCRGCKDTRTLAKYYPDNYGVFSTAEVVAFIDKHMGCSPHCGKGNLMGDRCFDLRAESADQ